MSPSLQWLDTPQRYGVVSRWLHWLMAAAFAWQFTSAVLHWLDRETAVAKFFWSTHGSLGLALMVLVMVRAAWGLANLRRRPGYACSLAGRAAAAGHLLLYALMIAVPLLALLRAYGRGRGFSAFGLPVFAPSGNEIPALIAPGHALHGVLGWLLLALAAGHIAMVFVHRRLGGEDVLPRMTRARARA